MPTIIPITDPDDACVAAYRQVRERDLIGRAGLFVAEGEVVLRALLKATRFRPVSLLIAAKRIGPLAPLLAGVPDDVPVYEANQAVLDGVVGFHIHRGILALGRSVETVSAEALLASLKPRALVVALFGLSNHDNMGGVFRNVAAFGADAVLLDPQCCDPLYRKALRVSVGAVLLTPFARLAAEEDGLSLLRAHDFQTLALSPGGATRLADLRRSDRAAVLLGAEGPGLPTRVLERTATVRIPMAEGFDSLNVATASGVVLHHLVAGETDSRQKR